MQAPPATTDYSAFISPAIKSALSSNKLSDDSPVAIFYNLPAFRNNCKALISAFPPSTLHAFALKAAPFPTLLRDAAAQGMGGECASIAEIALCKHADMTPGNIIFDSPAKTDAHLREVLRAGVHVNADNVEELERISRIRAEVGQTSTVGLRVNPQLGSATIAETFTAAAACKFGEPMNEARERIVSAFERYDFLTGIHVHVGSQGCETEVLVAGATAAVNLAKEINDRVEGRVQIIDIGGGLSVDYWGDTEQKFSTLVEMLIERCPDLFQYRIMTEFGRRVAAKTGFIVARVQQIKEAGGKTYVICHAGADLLMRPVYQREKWGHRIEVYDCNGQKRVGIKALVDVGGPICFSGDIIAKDREIVMPQEGDYLVVRDAGAYTLSLYCRHTSQLTPPVYGVEDDGSLKVIKEGETVEDVIRFWT